jgi:threonine aldolase
VSDVSDIDLRSDTVTHPTEEMLRAMSRAPLGDDVFSDDPTVNRLEETAAERMGKEAAAKLGLTRSEPCDPWGVSLG